MKVAIRADAYAALGTGHVMRCIALGQGIRDSGGEVIFVTYCDSEGLVKRLAAEGFDLHFVSSPGSLMESLSLFEKLSPDWVVLDGYHFETPYQHAVKEAGYKLMVIDDYAHLDYYYADIILNQNYGAEQFHYNANPDTKILLGTKFVMLRKEFLKYKGFQRQIPEIAKKLLITMGGADPDNHTLKVLKAVNLIEISINVKVGIGAANPHHELLVKEAEGSRHKIEILRGIEDMAPIMAWADAAVSAGGTTAWELAFMGLPALLFIVADNQAGAVNCLHQKGVFISCGRPSENKIEKIAAEIQALLNDSSSRKSMSREGRLMVDGRGIENIINALVPHPLTILFLGGGISRDLASWLENEGERVFYTEEKVDARYVEDMKPDMIVSYNYRYILKRDVLKIPPMGAVNLHISYLPWNRGAHPNVWSYIEDSPKGVTIHSLDEGIDTGDIIVQEEVVIDEDKETIGSSYEKLHEAIQALFRRNWDKIRNGIIQSRPQPSVGTLHYTKDSKTFEALLTEKSWATPIKELKEKLRNANIS